MPSKCKLVILISGSGSNLQSFIDACDEGTLDAEITAVISNKPEAFGLSRAADAGIDTKVVDHKGYSDREDFDEALANAIDGYSPDLVILAGFMRILTAGFVNHFKGRLLNIHPSLLPKYPGLNTHQRAIDAGDQEAGATVHFVTEQLDGGPPVIQARVPILDTDDNHSLAKRVLVKEHQIYPLAAQWFAEGRLRLDEAIATLDDETLPAEGYPFN